jgi:hypothetical protein
MPVSFSLLSIEGAERTVLPTNKSDLNVFVCSNWVYWWNYLGTAFVNSKFVNHIYGKCIHAGCGVQNRIGCLYDIA